LSGPFEHHITADVGMAAWNYYCVTQDKVWLKEKGWPLLRLLLISGQVVLKEITGPL
jgi:trehalose/maltose hydrolase-like predicted phosphorylase